MNTPQRKSQFDVAPLREVPVHEGITSSPNRVVAKRAIPGVEVGYIQIDLSAFERPTQYPIAAATSGLTYLI